MRYRTLGRTGIKVIHKALDFGVDDVDARTCAAAPPTTAPPPER